MRLVLLVLLPFGICSSAGAEEKTRHVLIIGVDGTRFDALQKARTPNFDRLMKTGALSEECAILGERYRKNDTVSGPSWSTILTGVWADKHGIHDNDFKTPNYNEYPHFFARVKQADKTARTVSLDSWDPIQKHIVSAADVSESLDPGKDSKAALDDRMAKRAIEVLEQATPAAMFVYIHQVDVAGHERGFHPAVPYYIEAIENADRNLGEILAALEARPTLSGEDWLVIVCTDHGGRGTNHGGGHDYPEVTQTFLILWQPGSDAGRKLPATELVDVVPTALRHLRIPIDPKWNLDGVPRNPGLE